MNAEKILVVGLQTSDAGKTTLCKAIIYALKRAGINVVPFKPHSGIGYWTQFGIFQRNVKNGTLVCGDIMELEEVAQSQLPIEILNPVNRLSSPKLSRGISDEELVFQEFVAERFTHYNGVGHKNIYYLNRATNVSQMRDMKTFFRKIKKNSEKFFLLNKFQDLVEAYSKNFDRATSSCYRHIKDKPLVIESLNDAACPFNEAVGCDVVLCISSNTVLQFDRNKYFNAIELYEGEKSKLQLTVLDIYSPSLIRGKYHIQPLNNQERKDPARLMENYSEIIKQLTKKN